VRARRRSSARALTVTLWVLQGVLAVQFAGAGVLKLAGNHQMVHMFATIGAGQWLRYAIGLVELAGAIGLLIPPLSGLAALGLVGLMVGATVTNAFVIDASPWIPVTYLLVAAMITWGRWPRTRALSGTNHRAEATS
jgi:uncharacterized membrane protein YphA (DoxX/SURF4 family)